MPKNLRNGLSPAKECMRSQYTDLALKIWRDFDQPALLAG
jgi:hypothetical protein